jgi:outer membrane biogenesis lipoprotein LolB
MSSNSLLRRAPLVVAALLSASAVTACAHPNNTYESPRESNRWDRREDRAYRQWEAERRYRHIEYARRVAAEQRAYWEWRRYHRD